MAKKGGFSFEGMIDPEAEVVPIEGVNQRGAGGKPASADVRPQPPRRGRPAKPRTATEARPSFGLDPETHALFKVWLIKEGLTMQDYLERHIKDLVKGIKF